MPYSKGISGNPSGRKKGSKNLTTREAKELLNQILFAEIGNIKEALSKIRTKDQAKYLDILIKLFPYVIPRKIDFFSDYEPENSAFSNMTKEEIEDELTQLWQKGNG